MNDELLPNEQPTAVPVKPVEARELPPAASGPGMRTPFGTRMPTQGDDAPIPGLSQAASNSFDLLRKDASTGMFPRLKVVSGFRDPDRNRDVGGANNSEHTRGNAVDIDVSGWTDEQKAALVDRAVSIGMRGVGIYKSGNSIHLDVRETPTIWGMNPAGPYKGMSLDEAPAWSRPALSKLFGGAAPPVAPGPRGVRVPTGGPINTATMPIPKAEYVPDAQWSNAQRARYEIDNNVKDAGFWEVASTHMTTQGISAQLFRQNPFMKPDPDFTLTTQMIKETGLPEHYFPRFENAVSREHFDQIVSRAKQDKDASERLATAGMRGVAATFLAEMFDPLSLTVAVGTGGIGAGMRMGRVVQGAAAAGANVALEGARSALSDEASSVGDFAMAAAIGGTFGMIFGPAAGRRATASVADDLGYIVESQRQTAFEPTVRLRPDAPADIVDVARDAVEAQRARDAQPVVVKTSNPDTRAVPSSTGANDNIGHEAGVPKSDWMAERLADPAVQPIVYNNLDDLRTLYGGQKVELQFETGKPITVVGMHGSHVHNQKPFNDFNPEFTGKGEGGGDTDGVFYFSADKKTAGKYAPEPETGITPDEWARKNELYRQFDEASDALWKHEQDFRVLYQKVVDAKDNSPDGDVPRELKAELETSSAKKRDLEKAYKDAEARKDSYLDETRNETLKPRQLVFENPLVYRSPYSKAEGWSNSRNNDLIAQAREGGHDGVILLKTQDGGGEDIIYIVVNPSKVIRDIAPDWKPGTTYVKPGDFTGDAPGLRAANDVSIPVEPEVATLRAANDPVKVDIVSTGRVLDPDTGRAVPHDAPLMTDTKFSLSAAANVDAEPQRLTDAVLRSVKDDIVPKTAGTVGGKEVPRWSVAGTIGRSDNPIIRMVGSLLFSDKVGKVGHAANRFSADEEASLYSRQIQTGWRSILLPAYKEWAKENGKNALFKMGWHDFNTEVWRAVVDRSGAPVSPSIARARDEARRLLAEMAQDQQNPLRYIGREGRPLAGAENLTPDQHYMPQNWSPSRMTEAVAEHGIGKVVATIAGGIKALQPAIDDDLATKFARAIAESRYTKSLGHDDRLSRILSNADQSVLRDTLENEMGWAAEDIERLLSQLARGHDNSTAASHLKGRIRLDPLFSHVDGDLAVSDLLETSADALLMNYSRNVAGRVALGRQRFVDPRNGEIIVDGIASNADFERLINAATKLSKDLGHNPEETSVHIQNLRWGYDRIRGVPDSSQLGDTASWLRVIRNVNFSLRMGALGLASLMDTGRVVGEVGLKAFSQHVPGFRRIVDMDGRLVRQSGLDRELEAVLGLGSDSLRSVQSMIVDDLAGIHGFRGNRAVDKAEAGTAFLADTVAQASLFHFVQSKLQLTTAKAIAQKFADLASEPGKLTKADRIRMRFGGLEDDMLDRILAQTKKHVSTADGVLFDGKVTQLNLAKWDDMEAAAHLERALYRLSRSIVQENDIGSMHRWMSHTLAQTLLQFRSFSLTAWDNQLLQSMHRGDLRALSTALWSTVTGGMVYATQVQLQAIGRSDREEFIRRRLGDPSTFATALFQRAGYSSIIPMVADTGALFFRDKPIFDARPSGQASDILFGNPTIGLLNDLQKGGRAVIDSAYRNKPFTQDDARALARLLPANNAVPIVNAISATISDLPRRDIR